tara:strand:+ start:1127 stop:1435 length:309 start_codon:yes stop_codon:yes gene_type:complete
LSIRTDSLFIRYVIPTGFDIGCHGLGAPYNIGGILYFASQAFCRIANFSWYRKTSPCGCPLSKIRRFHFAGHGSLIIGLIHNLLFVFSLGFKGTLAKGAPLS